jgi:hypothetical protein
MARSSSNSKLHTCPLVREGALHEEARNYETKENLKSGHGPKMGARHEEELVD